MRKIIVTTKIVKNFLATQDFFDYHYWIPNAQEIEYWKEGLQDSYCRPPVETADTPNWKRKQLGRGPGFHDWWEWQAWNLPQAEIATGYFFKESFSSKERPALMDRLEVSTSQKRKRPNAPKPPRLTIVPKFRYKEPVLRLLELKDLPPIPVPKGLRSVNPHAKSHADIKRYQQFVNWYATDRKNKLDRQKRFLEKVNSHREAKYLAKRKTYEKQLSRYALLVQSIKDKNNVAKLRYQRLWSLYERSLRKYERSLGSDVVRDGKGRINYPFNQYTKFSAYTVDDQELKLGIRNSWPLEGRTAYWYYNYLQPAFLSGLKDFRSSNPADQFKPLVQPYIDQCHARLVAGYYDRLGDQKVHFGNMLAEQVKTVEMLTTIFTAIVKLVMAKKAVFQLISKAVGDPRFIADQVLQFQFGLKPLWNDLQALFKTMGEYSKAVHIVHVKKTVTVQIPKTGSGGLAGRLTCSYVGEYDVVENTLREMNQWGMLDPSQIIWEVTPWSFVVDWLIPIGNFIASCSADLGLIWKRGVFAWRFVGTYDGMPSNASSQNSDYYFGGNFSLYVKRRELLLAPPSQLEILDCKNPFTINHTIDALALLVQGLRS